MSCLGGERVGVLLEASSSRHGKARTIEKEKSNRRKETPTVIPLLSGAEEEPREEKKGGGV